MLLLPLSPLPPGEKGHPLANPQRLLEQHMEMVALSYQRALITKVCLLTCYLRLEFSLTSLVESNTSVDRVEKIANMCYWYVAFLAWGNVAG